MESIQKILVNTQKLAFKWRKFKPIWKLDKQQMADKFAIRTVPAALITIGSYSSTLT